LPHRIGDEIESGKDERIFDFAQRMDEACNLAAELAHIRLPIEDYWTGLVSQIDEEYLSDSSSGFSF
jgi:hypothetical protein